MSPRRFSVTPSPPGPLPLQSPRCGCHGRHRFRGTITRLVRWSATRPGQPAGWRRRPNLSGGSSMTRRLLWTLAAPLAIALVVLTVAVPNQAAAQEAQAVAPPCPVPEALNGVEVCVDRGEEIGRASCRERV